MKSIKFTPFLLNATIVKYSVPAIILLHLCITLTLSKVQNVWIDEVYSFHTTEYGVDHVIDKAINREGQAPGYFVLLNLWWKINRSYFFARLLSVLCIFITLIVVAQMSKQLLPDIHPGWMTAIVAFHPSLMWAATLVRVYALVILLSTLLCKFFIDAYLSENPVMRAKWYYGLVSVLALYVYYPLGFILVANAAALLVLKRWRALRTYLLTMFIVAICFSPMIWIVLSHLSPEAHVSSDTVSFLSGLKWAADRVLSHIINPDRYDFFGSPRETIFWIGIVSIALFLFRKKGFIVAPKTIAFLTIVFILYLSMVPIFLMFEKTGIRPRHTMYIYPALLLCVFLVLRTIVGKKGVIICALILLFFSARVSIPKIPLPKQGDWAHVASYIMDSEEPRQPVLVYRSESALPLAVYYSGINDIIPIPKKTNLETSLNLHDWVIKDERELTQTLSKVLNDYQHFWLVTDTLFEWRDVKFSHDLLLETLSKEYTTVTTKVFYGSIVRFMHRKLDIPSKSE